MFVMHALLVENPSPVQALALGAVLTLGQLGVTHADSVRADGHLAEDVPKLLEQYSRQGDFQLPGLSTAELDTLAAGEVIVAMFHERTVDATEQPDSMRVVGFKFVTASRLLVWLSILSGNEASSARIKHAELLQQAAGAYVSYHYMDLPWPVKDRQWTLLCDENLGLADVSHDVIWEHRWSLLPRDNALLEQVSKRGLIPGLARRALEDSVYLGANRGAWILFDLGARGTLVAATMDIDFGGHIPDALVRSFARHQLRTFLEGLSSPRRSDYAATPLIHDGRGLPITRDAALAAARFPPNLREIP